MLTVNAHSMDGLNSCQNHLGSKKKKKDYNLIGALNDLWEPRLNVRSCHLCRSSMDRWIEWQTFSVPNGDKRMNCLCVVCDPPLHHWSHPLHHPIQAASGRYSAKPCGIGRSTPVWPSLRGRQRRAILSSPIDRAGELTGFMVPRANTVSSGHAPPGLASLLQLIN